MTELICNNKYEIYRPQFCYCILIMCVKIDGVMNT